MTTRHPLAITVLLALCGSAFAGDPGEGWVAIVDGKEVPCPAIPMGDDSVTRAILDEGKNRNQVMVHLKHLTQSIGARLTGSTNAETANNWCKQQYEAWGLTNAHLDKWGEIACRFDRGPSTGKIVLRRESKNPDGTTTPEYEGIRDLEFTTQAWTHGTNGPVRARVVRQPKNAEEFLLGQPTLAGAWVLVQAPPAVGQRGIRSGLSAIYEARRRAKQKIADGTPPADLSIPERVALEPVAGYISTSRDERVWTGAAPGWRELDPDAAPREPHVVIRGSDYDFLNSRVTDGEPIEAEFDLQHTFIKGPIPVYNTIAEITGDTWPEQVVIISAHLDSWNGPGSQGCTDNGTGSAVTLEAARILAALKVKPKRTIRFIHWTGEEQGLLGSRAYVEAHKDEWPNISAAFVDDGGTNYEGGLPATEEQVDMLAAATAPVNNLFYSETDKKHLNVDIHRTPTPPRGGSSDHASFNRVGVPGFFWDEVGRADYGYGWHTQHDKYELAVEEYLKQSSTNAAVVAYRLACADTLLPRPPAPAEPPAGERPAAPRRRRPENPAPTQ